MLIRASPREAPADGAGEGIRTPDLLITNQLLYQPELRQPDQKRNYSTSRASCATPAHLAQVRQPAQVAVLGALRRCRRASNSTTPAATKTFNLRTCRCIVTHTSQSHRSTPRLRKPAPSPTT